MKLVLKVILSSISRITRNDRPRRRRDGVGILVPNNINFDIVDTCSSIDTNNEATTIILKNSQYLISISIIYIPPSSTINTTLLNKKKKTLQKI